MLKSNRFKDNKVWAFFKLLSVVLLLAVFLAGCGGGFGTDSNDYEDLKETIFGRDST